MRLFSFENFVNEKHSALQYVYHVLDYKKLKYVIDNNKITSYHFSNISTSRDPDFSNYVGDDVTSWFKLELDYKKLNKVYKNRSFVYVSSTNVSMPEEEEQQFLTQEISPAFDYITKVILIKGRLERSMYNFHTQGEYSDWMTDAPTPRRKIPEIIKEYYELLKSKNIPLYVQELDGVIKRDDAYILKLINTPLKHVNIYYAYVYRKNKYKKLHSSEDVIYDPFKLKDHVLVIGYSYPKKDFITLAASKEELVKKYPTLRQEIQNKVVLNAHDAEYYREREKRYGDDEGSMTPVENSVLSICMFRDDPKDVSKYYLNDIKPYNW